MTLNPTSLFTDDFPEVNTQAELDKVLASFPGYDPYYICSGAIPDRRKRFEDLYKVFKNYKDTHFLSQLKTQFHQRTWEMYVGCSLIVKDIKPTSFNEGPDFLIEGGDKKIWIECAAPNKGAGEDRVPAMEYGTVQTVPENQMCIRLTNTLYEKLKQYKKHVKKGVISESDIYIIAINSGDLGFPDGAIPLILRVVFGIGYPTITFSSSGGEKKHGWSRIFSIKKKNESEVSTDFFLKPENNCVSGILYCGKTVLNHAIPWGDDILGVSNPIAKNPFPNSFRQFKGYYYDPRASEWSLKPS